MTGKDKRNPIICPLMSIWGSMVEHTVLKKAVTRTGLMGISCQEKACGFWATRRYAGGYEEGCAIKLMAEREVVSVDVRGGSS